MNPESGIIATTNNRLTSIHVKHGITMSFNMQPRTVRGTRMIQSEINAGRKISVDFMKEVQKDVYDLQSEDSLPFMLKHVKAWQEEALKILYPGNPK